MDPDAKSPEKQETIGSSKTPSDASSSAPKDDPAPRSLAPAPGAADPPNKTPPVDPTRYGDWEKNGRCIDF
jgi:hypothetical protein